MSNYDLKTSLGTVSSSPVKFSFRKGPKGTQILTKASTKRIEAVEKDLGGKTTEVFRGVCFKEAGQFIFATSVEPPPSWKDQIKTVFTKSGVSQAFTLRKQSPKETETDHGAAETDDGEGADTPEGTPAAPKAAAEPSNGPAATATPAPEPKPQPTPPAAPAAQPAATGPDIEKLKAQMVGLKTSMNAAIQAHPTRTKDLIGAVKNFNEQIQKEDAPAAQKALGELANLLKELRSEPAATPPTATAAASAVSEAPKPEAVQSTTPATGGAPKPDASAPATGEAPKPEAPVQPPEPKAEQVNPQAAPPPAKKVEQVINWDDPAPVQAGSKLSEAQLNATGPEDGGALTYSKPVGTVLTEGNNKVTAMAAGTARYLPATKSVVFVATKGTQVIQWEPLGEVSAGEPLTKDHLNAERTEGDGVLTYMPPLGSVSKSNAETLQLKVMAAGTVAYKPLTETRTIKIVRKKRTLRWDETKVYAAGQTLQSQGFALEMLADGEVVAGEPKFTPSLGFVLTRNDQTYKVTAPQTEIYEKLDETIVVKTKGQTVNLKWDKPANIIAGTKLTETQLNASVVPGDGLTPKAAKTIVLKYNPPLGKVLLAGDNQTLAVTTVATDQFEATTATVQITVEKTKPVITWTPGGKPTVGGKLTAAELNASVQGGGELTYNLPLNTPLTKAGPLELIVTATETPTRAAGTEKRTVTVAKPQQKIDWANPADINAGTALSATQLNAARTVGDGALTYVPALNTTPVAGLRQKLTVTAKGTADYAETSKTVLLNVRKPRREIVWNPPGVVAAGAGNKFKLTATQLNAVCAPGKGQGDGTAVYSPPLNSQLGLGNHTLKVTFRATANFEQLSVTRKMIVMNAKAKQGADVMKTAAAWKNPMHAAVKADWDADTDGVKGKAQTLMSDLTKLSGAAIKDHMDKIIADTGDTAKADKKTKNAGLANEYFIWKLPNKLQVRYKPNGDPFSNGEPTFCVELRASAGFSNSQNDIAAKLLPDGTAAPKGPKDVTLPVGLNKTQKADFKSGSSSVTHPRCQPKLDQVIEWAAPADMVGPEPLSQDRLNAVVIEGDGALTYLPTFDDVPAIGQINLKVEAAETSAYKLTPKLVPLKVTAAPAP